MDVAGKTDAVIPYLVVMTARSPRGFAIPRHLWISAFGALRAITTAVPAVAAMAAMAAVADEVHPDERNADQHPEPVYHEPLHDRSP
jgi:hypothetical protein